MKSSFIKSRNAHLSVYLVLLLACDPTDLDVPPIDPPDALTVDFAGTYSVSGTWDLSGPFGNGQTFGDHVGELMVHRIVTTLGVPALAEEDVKDAVRELAHQAIKDVVDANVPANLAPGGEVYDILAMTLASVKAEESILVTGTRPSINMSAKETVTKLLVPSAAGEIEIPLQDLKIDATDIVRIESEFTAKITSATTIEFEQHVMDMRIGQLLIWIIENLTNVNVQDQTDALLATVDCAQFTSAVTGGSASVRVTVGNEDFDLDDSVITNQCNELKTKLAARILGIFDPDTKISIGGSVNAVDSDGDKAIDTLSSAAQYGGEFQVVGAAFNPAVSVSFSASRN